MAHSVEFLLDEASELQIREQWMALADAQLPSQADIRSATNRPHITAIAAEQISAEVDGALATVGMRLPFAVRLGGLVVFGHGPRRVIARLVVPTTELLSVHSAIVRLGAEFARRSTPAAVAGSGLFDHCMPGSWTPHVTLARRVPLDRIGAVLGILSATDPEPDPAAVVTVTGLRRWDPDTGTDHIVGGRSC